MKLIQIQVENFGSLHNYHYEFEDGLNVVLEDNGWGKTTMAAFLKAMFYGFGSKRSKDIVENERKRYLPWQGGTYGGLLDFEMDGVRYRITRTFGEQPRFDRTKIINLDTNTPARIDPEMIGETIFKLDASAFQRSVFINQNGLGIEGASGSIHTRLNSLVSQANDVAAFDGAIKNLTEQTKVYEKMGNRGQLADVIRQIASLEAQRKEIEEEISRQDSDRARISEIDVLLTSINKELEEKKQKLEKVSGEAKKLETQKKLQEDIALQIGEIQKKMDAIQTELGGHIPGTSEIDQIKTQTQAVGSLTGEIKLIEESFTQKSNKYSAISELYHGRIPTSSQLDELQSVYGELQGAGFTIKEEAAPEQEAPEGYTAISWAANSDEDYISNLRETLNGQMALQQLVRSLDSKEQELQNEKRSIEEKKQRYISLKKEVTGLQIELEQRKQYTQEDLSEAVQKLQEIQQQKQLLDLRAAELSKDALSPEELKLVSYTGELPDSDEVKGILNKFRDMTQKEASLQGLYAKLEGEKSKEEGLKASLNQLDSIAEPVMPDQKDSAKSLGLIIAVAGVVIATIGLILLFAVGPLMAILMVLGLILIAAGIVLFIRSKKESEAREQVRADLEKQRQEVQGRQAEARVQLIGSQSVIESLEQEISNTENSVKLERSEITRWYSKWGQGSGEISESAINGVLDNARYLKQLQQKKRDYTEKEQSLASNASFIAEERKKVDLAYPEISGKSIMEALELLRGIETDQKIRNEKLESANTNLERFLKEEGIPEEEFKSGVFSKIQELTKDRNEASKALGSALAEADQAFIPIGLSAFRLPVTMEDVTKIYHAAQQKLHEYDLYADKVKGHDDRQQKKREQLEGLHLRLKEKEAVLQGNYVEMDYPERLNKVREDIENASLLKKQIETEEADLKRKKAELEINQRVINRFLSTYVGFEPQTDDVLKEIYDKTSSYADLESSRKTLESQKSSIVPEQSTEVYASGEDEVYLRQRVEFLEIRRDSLRDEYTQKNDYIRQADQSLEKLPDIDREIAQLYDRKQKIQNTLNVLKRTIQLIKKAKENLADRYLSKVEDTFNDYMHIWLANDTIRGILDIDFNVMIEEDEKTHVAAGYSTGTCDLIDFCMRLALVDTLFEKEQPFLILDDPFVNLDEEHLSKALDLLNVMAVNKQLIYFVCHPIRVVEANSSSATRDEFLKLEENIKKSQAEQRSSATQQKKSVRKSPREMYKVVSSSEALPFKVADPNYTITNSIFSLRFIPGVTGFRPAKNGSYELFFIDAVGRVLNERQILEINNGTLSKERIQFSLNTREDSGDQFELMIRESGQDDYDVIARIPFKVKMAFVGTASFDF